MSQLYTTAAAIRASGAEGVSAHKPKYHLRAGAEYLHLSGLMLTSERCWAWIGNIEQARTARKRFPAAAGCKARPVKALPIHTEMEA